MLRVFTVSLLLVSLPSLAQTPPQPAGEPASTPQPAPDDRVDALEQSVRVLERKSELDAEKSAEKAKTGATVSVSDKGFVLKSADGAFQLKVRALLQTDGRGYPFEGQPLVDTFLVRRARPYIDATVLDVIDLRLMPDFGDGKVLLYDAYADVRLQPWLRLRAGKFKPPVGLERLQSAANTHFLERSYVTQLVPNRDVGVQLSGDFARSALTAAVGVFNGAVDNTLGDNDVNENKELAGRVFAHPFRFADVPRLADLGIGVAASYGRQSGNKATPNLPSYKSAGQQTIFTYDPEAFAAGERFRFSPQAYAYVGSFGFLGEYAQSRQPVSRGAVHRELKNQAWQGTVTYVVTGEDARYDGVVPADAFDPGSHHLGAFDLVARYQELRIDPAAFPILADDTKSVRDARTFGVGGDWYLNRNARIGLDLERTTFEGGAAGGDRPVEYAVLGRMQLAF